MEKKRLVEASYVCELCASPRVVHMPQAHNIFGFGTQQHGLPVRSHVNL